MTSVALLRHVHDVLLDYIVRLEKQPMTFCGAGRGTLMMVEAEIRRLGGPEYESRRSGVVLPTDDVHGS